MPATPGVPAVATTGLPIPWNSAPAPVPPGALAATVTETAHEGFLCQVTPTAPVLMISISSWGKISLLFSL